MRFRLNVTAPVLLDADLRAYDGDGNLEKSIGSAPRPSRCFVYDSREEMLNHADVLLEMGFILVRGDR